MLTGGHAATTAIATIEELIRRKGENLDLYWIGSKTALEGKKHPTLESRYLPKMGVSFKPIVSGRLQRKFTIWTIPSYAKIPLGIFNALFLLIKIKPKVTLSFGGFAAFPVVFSSWLLRIPVVIHEQTAAAGRANLASKFFAKKIAISRASSKEYFPSRKTVLTGNPILTQVAEISPKSSQENPPVIFVTGGSRGSVVVNKLIDANLEKLLGSYRLIHQTGFVDNKRFKEKKKNLKKSLGEKYEIFSVIEPMDIDGVYKRADVVIARAGANTVSELVAMKRPCLLVPIPWSYKNEQVKNAEFAKSQKIAKIFSQDNENSGDFLKDISNLVKNQKRIVESAKTFDFDKQASKRLVDILEEYLS